MTRRVSSVFGALLGGSVLAQVVLIGCSMLFARVYSPEAFGTLAQITGVASIATIVAGLRFDHMAFSRPDAEKAYLYGAAFLVLLATSAALCVAAFPVAWLNPGAGADYVWAASFVMANGAYYLCSQWQIAQGSYVAFGRVRILQAALQMAIGGTVFVMAPAHGMVVAAIISQAAAAALAMRGAQLRPAQPWGRETIACMRTNAKAAFTNSASALLQYATPLAPVVAGSLFLAKADIGAYFLFSSAVAAPGAVLRRAILSYFNGEVKDAEQLRSLLAGMTARTGLLVLVGAGALGMLVLLHHFAGALTDLVFGPRWHHYSGLLLPLVVFFGLDTLLQPFSTFLGMWGRERSQVAIEVLRFSLTYLAWPLLVFAFGLQFEAAIVVFLVLMSAVYLLNCAVVLRAPPQSVGVPAP